MSKKKNIRLSFVITVMILFTFGNTQASATSDTIISPTNNMLHYEGRIDKSNPQAVKLLWEGSIIKANFEGTSLKMQLENSSDNYLNVIIDNKLTVIKCLNGDNLYTLASGMEDKIHSVEIFKRTEAGIGAVNFKGFILDSGKQLAPFNETKKLQIEFYGDSITVGACDEDTGYDQWSNYYTHNNYMSYSAITARELNAEYMCTAVSGIGLTHGFQPYSMPQIWDRIAYDPNSTPWDYNSWQADYVVVNLGENDKSCGIVGDFTSEYVKFIKNIREKYPNALIFCVAGPMGAGQDQTMLNYVSSAVSTLNSSGDNKVFFHKFSQSCSTHPRVETNIEVAKELVDFINSTNSNMSTILYGDVNGDKKVDMLDYMALQKYVFEGTGNINKLNSDINKDTRINTADLFKLRKMILEY
ncbi:endoglucanase E precursor [Clostridium puniceum]|uniref:Endoglucanase E n=1 Tax=Clostridium puniceum TaxID=29367 RepID=A0A1S8TX31_9CLOT|nr:dockerin type I domain-containing protein [Clostridium puniceum]OOM82132.1 endoglucanase E precursor [Clostridium puniceum]